jgi:acetoin utilization protein AcuC
MPDRLEYHSCGPPIWNLRLNGSHTHTNLWTGPIKTAFIWDDALASYRFSQEHPLDPRRLELTLALIRAMGLLDSDDVLLAPPRPATDEELMTVHTKEYINAVKRGEPNLRYGLGTEDVPVIPGMHEAGAMVVGATLVAAELVMSGTVTRAFNMAGGLHHAHRNQASGFCVYSDLAIAIRYMQKQHGARVMYIDYDAHHGDGVQWIFYDDPNVLTVSLHESGKYIFPGTGFAEEVGEGAGYGFTANFPFEPGATDAEYGAVFHEHIPKLAEKFKPDVIVLQNGCDSHAVDPLTDLGCTTRIYEDFTRLVGEVADRHCGGRIVATGGGGYAIHEVVPRAWTLVWAALRGVDVADEIPPVWAEAAERDAGRKLPRTLRDSPIEAF